MTATGIGLARRVTLVVVVAASTTLFAPPAHGASTSVAGTGVYEKLVLANNQNAVVIKMFGPRARDCGWTVYTTVRDLDGTRYTAERACLGEKTRHTSLMRGGLGGTIKACGGLEYGYNATEGFHKLTVPRSCLTGLADRIKVTQSVMQVGSPSPSEAGPTTYVDRG